MKPATPPRWIDWLLERTLPSRLHEAVMGDLDEKFAQRLRHTTPRWKARSLYALEGIGFLRMARISTTPTNSLAMYRNYLLIAFRNIRKDRLYVGLNIAGLALGLACVMTLYVYIRFETSYDKFHPRADRIYRVPEAFMDDARLVSSAMNHGPMAPLMQQHLAGVQNVIRVFPYSAFFNSFVASGPEQTYKESRFCFGDSVFFRTFSFTSLTGPLYNALDAPYTVVIVRSMAEKYFGDVQHAVGNTLKFSNDERSFDFVVTGVIDDIPHNSHLSFDFMASFSSLDQFMPWYNNWHHPAMYLYLEMQHPVDPRELSEQVQRIARDHQPAYVREENRTYNAQALTDIHLHSHLENEWEANAHYDYLKIYVVCGLFILAIACVNFMNIATARASMRAKEVGMRKVLGGRRGQLVFQFFGEATVYCVLAFVLALGVAQLFFVYFLNGLIGKSLTVVTLFTWQNALLASLFLTIVILISGAYPALFLSGFRPAAALKGKLTSHGSAGLRRTLVVAQFVISSLLISATLIITRQVNFMKETALGFDKEHVITIRLSDRFAQQNYSTLKEALLSESTVKGAALSSTIPGREDFHGFDIKPEGEDAQVSMKTLGVDEDFLSTFNLELIDGRDFSKEVPTDQREAFIMNEAAAKRMGWNTPVGKSMDLTVYINKADVRPGKVIGLVRDFHFESLHRKVEPLLLYINKHPYYSDYLSVKFSSGDVASSVALLRKHWKAFNPEKPIDIRFLDDELEQLYAAETRIGSIFKVLAGMSILISCLGLFGLSAFMAEKRTKEVGIRKVMGASLTDIVRLQARGFILLVLIANALVLPLCWWGAQQWLSGFAYHTAVSPLTFVITLLVTVTLILLTTLYHSIRMAKANPVTAIRQDS